jgi:hypothetical protein
MLSPSILFFLSFLRFHCVSYISFAVILARAPFRFIITASTTVHCRVGAARNAFIHRANIVIRVDISRKSNRGRWSTKFGIGDHPKGCYHDSTPSDGGLYHIRVGDRKQPTTYRVCLANKIAPCSEQRRRNNRLLSETKKSGPDKCDTHSHTQESTHRDKR